MVRNMINKMKSKTMFAKTMFVCLLLGYTFLFTPMFILIINSFGDSEVPGVWSKFTFKWFKLALQDHELLQATMTSLKIATISASGAVVLGVSAAVATCKSSQVLGKKFLSNIIIMPIVMPEIIIGFSLLMLFLTIERFIGISFEKGIITVCIGHTMATMAYVHMNVRSKILMLDSSIEEAASNLGASSLVVFWKIKLPMLRRSIIASWVVAFTMSLDDLVIASFLTGPGSTTLPILIFSNVRTGITPMINAFATMLILIITLCIVITYTLSSSEKNK